MPANKESRLHGEWLGPPCVASMSPRPCLGCASCSLEAAGGVSGLLARPGAGMGLVSGARVGAGLLGKTGVELRGWRKTWVLEGGTGQVSRSDGPSRVTAALDSAQGLGVRGRCLQEASKCLRIWKSGGGESLGTAPGGHGLRPELLQVPPQSTVQGQGAIS